MITKLGEIITVLESGSRPKGGVKEGREGIPSLGGEHLSKEGGFNFSKLKMISHDFFSKMKRGKIEIGDILIVKDGATTGKVAIVREDFPFKEAAINEHLFRIRVDSDKAVQEYIFRYLQSPLGQLQILSSFRGAAIGGINTSFVNRVSLDLPSIDEQKRIASILDKADEIKHESAKARVLRKDVVQSLFYDMFGDPVANPMDWQIRVLGDICGVGSSKRVFKTELVEEGIPFYRGTEIGKLGNGESITPSLFITKQHYEALKEHSGVPKIGDLLMPSICPDGRIFTVINDSPFYFKDGRVLWIKVDQSVINSTFLRYLLKAIFYSNYENIASGTTFAELKIFALKKMMLPLPPIELQDKFAKILKLIQKTPTTEVLAEDNSNSIAQEILT